MNCPPTGKPNVSASRPSSISHSCIAEIGVPDGCTFHASRTVHHASAQSRRRRKPRKPGRFSTGSQVSWVQGNCLAGVVVCSYPFSAKNSLKTGNLQGKIVSFRDLAVSFGRIAPAFQGLRGHFPNRLNREITRTMQGNEMWEQGCLALLIIGRLQGPQ